ncbi:hypothetical protein [Streptomyces chartreusis]|uniref:hypothetical protein n=1 Tax=Streptomyces chartreusis TaxID=1969 RepID=UPI003820269C
MARWPVLCTCKHTDEQHAENGPCQADDSYGQPCECPSLEPSKYENDTDVQTDTDEEHWGPQLGGHQPPPP